MVKIKEEMAMTHKMKRDVPTQCVIGIIIQLFIFMGAAWAMEGNLPDRVSRSTLSAPVGMDGRAFQQAYNKFFSWKTARELLDNIHDQQAGVSNTLLRELGQIENRGEIIREMAGYPHIESILSIPHLKENNRVMGKVCVLSNAPRTKKITVLISYPGRYGGVFPGKVSPKHVIMGDSGVSLVLARKGINEGAVYHISATGKKTETVVFPANAAFLNLNITHGGITTVELTRKVKLGGARAVQFYTQYYITPEGMVIKVNDESTQFPLAAAIDDINGMATYVIKDNDGLYAVCHISKQGKKKIVVTGSRYEPKVEWRPGGSMIVTAQDVVDVGGRMFNSYAVYHISPASVIKKVAGTIYPFPDEPGMKPQIIMNDRGGVVVLTPLKNFGRITYKLDYVNVKGETVRMFNSDAKPRIKLSEEGALLLAVPHS
ncbi:MAG: hypothetical protein PHO30_07875 [Candidatus Omnitrophica bacterium]|nr:hypothetical protein [Candidatus Omnitrophota bacterium]